jgi:hypothetical protein
MNNNMGNSTQHIRQTNIQNGTILQQQMTSGLMTTPTSIVRVNQPQQTMQNQGQFVPQTWTNNLSPHQFTLQKPTQSSSVLQYTTVKNGTRKYLIYRRKKTCLFL